MSELRDEAKCWGLPPDMDEDCIRLCISLNQLDGIMTKESCCGHGEEPHRIFFDAETIDALLPIMQGIAYGDYPWIVRVFPIAYTSNKILFVLEGPIGPADMPGGADELSKYLIDYKEQ
jgi:hypothetical protein